MNDYHFNAGIWLEEQLIDLNRELYRRTGQPAGIVEIKLNKRAHDCLKCVVDRRRRDPDSFLKFGDIGPDVRIIALYTGAGKITILEDEEL